MQFAEGCQTLDQEIFTGSTLQTKGYLRAGALGVGLSPEITTDNSETRGLSLVRIPVKECDNVKDFRAEYYLQDIYGNELVLGDKVTEAEMPMLAREIAKKVEDELDYPGQIKVNIVRETRAVDYAK